MNWKFIKTNWFTIALVLLVLVAIVRHKLPPATGGATSPGHTPQQETNPEKYTAVESNSLLGFSAEPSGGGGRLATADKAAIVAFVRRFEQVAVSERKKFGIPSSVLLAYALVNSAAGKSEAVAEANNYFALPCDTDWEGEKATVNGRCVRRYESAWASFRDFSIYLTGQEWFGSVRKSAGKDWQKWAKELSKRGISQVPELEKEMEKAIQAHRLYDLDAL